MAFNLFNTLNNGLAINADERTVSVIPQLAQKDYAQVKSILNRLGGDWNTSKQVFEFRKCPEALIDRVLSVGSRQLNKFHFYPTPEAIFEYITQYTALSFFGASQKSVRVLEPSAGEGSLIRQLLAFGEEEGRNFVVDGYDIDPLNVIFCQEAGLNVTQADFLTISPSAEYDLVLMNPPFNGDEFIKHIRHAQQFLKPEGMLISVVPTQWILSHANKDNRSWLLEQAQIDSTTDIDPNNFFEPGTFKGVSIPTTVICLRSLSAAERTLNSDQYKASAVESFGFYVDNCGKTWDRLHKLKMAPPLGADETIEAVRALVARILKDQSADTFHLVRRYEEDYIFALIEEWFPEHTSILRPPAEPEQLDFMTLLEGQQAA